MNLLPRARALALEQRELVVAVQVDLEGLAGGLVTLHQLLLDVGLAEGAHEGGDPVHVVEDVVDHQTGLDHAGPADHRRDAEPALEGRTFFAMKW